MTLRNAYVLSHRGRALIMASIYAPDHPAHEAGVSWWADEDREAAMRRTARAFEEAPPSCPRCRSRFRIEGRRYSCVRSDCGWEWYRPQELTEAAA